jgi:GntR family transcriptional regulator / MocR family aminotransferase
MRIPIDRQGAIPLYQQIETYLRDSIRAGTLAPETRLPATRVLARDLGVSRITIENAYAALEADGLVERRTGSGTYVLPWSALPPQRRGDTIAWPLWQHTLVRTATLAQDEVATSARWREPHPHPISFTGFGDPRLFPIADFAKAIREVMRRDGSACLAFDDRRGYEPLRTTVAQILASQGVQAHPANILITTGSQQALALMTHLVLKPGDTVLVERPTYDGALDLFRAHQLTVIGCPVDAHGMQVEHMEPLLQQHHPKLIYTIPNFQNPTGAHLSLDRRRALVALADRYNVPLLEDDFVGELRYEGRLLPALKALDPGGRVIYVGTFSKLLMPSLRIGFLVAEGPVYDLLVQRKWASDLATSTLIQRALELYISVGRYQAHVRRSCQVYRKRRDAIMEAIRRYLPSEVQVIAPHGGLFVWVRLPASRSALQLQPVAREEGVEYVAGAHFFPQPDEGRGYVRLNFATQTEQDIEEGIQRLGRALQRVPVRNTSATYAARDA